MEEPLDHGQHGADRGPEESNCFDSGRLEETLIEAIKAQLARGVKPEDIRIHTPTCTYGWSPLTRRWEVIAYE
jgi:hypothetical protein